MFFFKHQKTRNNNQRDRQQQDRDLPTFTINPVNPDSAIGKFFKLGQNNPPKLKKLPNPRPQQQQPNLLTSASERNQQRQQGPKRGSKIERKHVKYPLSYF